LRFTPHERCFDQIDEAERVFRKVQ